MLHISEKSSFQANCNVGGSCMIREAKGIDLVANILKPLSSAGRISHVVLISKMHFRQLVTSVRIREPLILLSYASS